MTQRFDAWTNLVTGLNTSRDKSTYSKFMGNDKLPDPYLDALYHDNDMASTICDTLPEEALRQGYSFTLPVDITDTTLDTDEALAQAKQQEQAVMDKLYQLGVQQKLTDALVWSEVFGASAILFGAVDGADAAHLSEPLNETALQDFTHINVVDRRYMTPLKWYSDPTLPKFGQPETYIISQYATDSVHLSAGVMEVHETRMYVFGGVRTSLLRRQQNGGWEDSKLQRVHHVLRQFGVGWDTLENLLQDANQGVYKIKGYIDALAANDENVITKRMQMIDMARSIVRAVVLDAEDESFERQSFSWSGVEKPYELLMYRLSAAARFPMTVLFGRSPAGMNATGESDIRLFYDKVGSYRENKVKPALERIIELVLRAKNGPTSGDEPDGWQLVFPSLWQLSPTEEATMRKTQAETDKIYVEIGTLTPDEVALSRFTPEGWSAETTIDYSSRLLKEPEPEPEPVVPVPAPAAPMMEEPADLEEDGDNA